MRRAAQENEAAWPVGAGEMAGRIRAHDWAATPLGPTHTWPQSLRTAVDMVLAMPGPATILWGPASVQLYNDAYVGIARDRHPALLGRPVAEGWPDVFEAVIAPLLEASRAGQATRLADFPVVLRGPDGRLEARAFDTDWSPIRDERGAVAGALQTLAEVTVMRRAEARLREGEARDRLLIESWAQAVWETDAEDVVVADSPSWRAYTGQTLEEWFGYGWLDAIHPDDRAYAERQWREAVAARGLVDAEFRLRAPDGGWRWTNVRAAPVLDAVGRIAKWAGMNIDIEARKRIEARLRASEEHRRIALESGGMGAWRWDLTSGRVWGDGALLSMWGFPPSTADINYDSFTDRISAEGAKELAAKVSEAVEAGESFEGDLEVVGGPTKGRWVRWRGRADPLQPTILQGVSFDITERRAVETALRESEERQAFLLKLSDALRPLADPAAIQGEATRQLLGQLDLSRCWYSEFDNQNFTVLEDAFRDGLPSLVGTHDFSDCPEYLAACLAGRVLAVPDIVTSPLFSQRVKARYAPLGARAALLCPLVKEGELIAVLSAVRNEARPWPEWEVGLVGEVAERTWAAVERARAEAALRESEERLRGFGEASQDILWIRDVEGLQWEYLSPAFEAIYGLSREEALSGDNFHNWADLILPEDREHAVASIGRVAKGERVTFEYRIRRPVDGAVRWLRNTDFPMRDPAGAVERIGGVGQDVTELKAAEARLRDSEELFRSFADNSADTLWIVDAETLRLDYLSPAFERMWGERRERVMAGLHRWTELLHPDDRDNAAKGLPLLLKGGRHQQTYRILRPSDGAERFIQDTGFPIRDAEGRVRRVAGIAQDATDQVWAQRRVAESEGRLRSLVEGIPQLVWRARDAGEWTWASPQWTAHTGQAEPDSRGHGWLTVIHPDDRARAMAAWEGAAERRTELAIEYRVLRASDGRHRWFATRAAPVREAATGAVLEWLGTSTDIDELRTLQERQKLLLGELQHRVRNTLAVVRSIARRSADTSDTVESYSMHLQGRIDAFARVQAAVTRNPAAGVDLETLVADEMLAYRAQEGDKVARLKGPRVRLQPRAAETLALAIHELATNAVKHGALSAERGRVAVTWRIEGGAEPRLVLEWTETGMTLSGQRPERRGFGMELLERTLAYDLDGEASLDFTRRGLRCRISVPAHGGILVMDDKAA